jgi:hypothetical protein
MLNCINDSYNRKVYIILNYATWRKRCFVCSKRERDLLTECSMGRDDAKDLEALTQSTIMYKQSRPFAVEVEGSGKYVQTFCPRSSELQFTHTHTRCFRKWKASQKHASAKQGVTGTIDKAFSSVLVVRICLQ